MVSEQSAKNRLWLMLAAAAVVCAAAGFYASGLSPRPGGGHGLSVAPGATSNAAFRVAAIDGFTAASDGAGWREVAAGDEALFGRPLRAGPATTSELAAGTTRLTVGPSATVTPCSGVLAKLTAGNLKVSAPEHADAPFTVDTSYGKVMLQGGEMQLHADAERVLIKLLHGHAELTDGSRKVTAAPAGKIVALTTAGFTAATDGWSLPATFTPPETQPDAEAHATPPAHGSPGIGRLVLHDSFGREMGPLEIQQLNVKTTILGAAGSVALTEIEETFFNPGDRQAEGTFYFTAPPGASLARLAMWVGDTLVEGELVDRARARHVYEEIVRRMQDPALMEWQEGNVFKTRIFPIPAHGAKRIIVAYTQALAAQDGEYCYVYPLGNTTDARLSIGRFQFDATVTGGENVTCRNFADARIDQRGANTAVSLLREKFKPSGDLALRFHGATDAPLSLAADRRSGESGFFLLSYRAPHASAPVTDMAAGEATPAPRDLVLMIDTSLSRHADDYHAQLRAARVLLEQLRPEDRFAILSFDVTQRMSTQFSGASPSHINAAIAELEAIVPLGATDIGAAFARLADFLKNNPARGNPDAILLGDGIATFGKTSPSELLPQAREIIHDRNLRFSAMVLGALQERVLLSELARAGGGLFRTVTPGANVEAEAFRLGLALESALLPAPKITFSGAEVTEVYPDQPGAMLPGQEILIVGRYAAAGKLDVRVEQGGGSPLTRSFDLPETDSSNVFIPRLWAREKLDMLLAQPAASETVRQIVALSQEFTLISPYTSFLVLENEKQYEQYGITRQLRRRYWEEQGKLRSAPPAVEAQPAQIVPPAQPAQPTPAQPATPAQTVQAARPSAPVELPKPFFETLDLTALGQKFGEGREVSTALSTLCLEVYYRYRQLTPDNGGGGNAGGAAIANGVLAMREREVDSEHDVSVTGHFTNAPRGPIQARDVTARPEILAPPRPTDTTAVDSRGAAAQTSLDTQLAQTSHEFLDNIPVSPGTGGGWGGGDGTGTGVNSGNGHGSFGMRNGGGRRLMVMRHGGSVSTESAADSAESWLESQQRDDGHWGAAGFEETSFALLAFLGAGHTEKVGSHKQAVTRGVRWLKSMQSDSGRVGSNVYEHALATLALSEAAGMARIPDTTAAAQKAVNHLTHLVTGGTSIGVRSGWALSFNAPTTSPSNTLVTAFAIFAMKSAKVAGLHVEMEAFSNALNYLDEVQTPDGAVGSAGKPVGTEINLLNTAALAAARVMLGVSRDDARVNGASTHLLRLAMQRPLSQDRDGLFMRYFATLLMFQMGGDPWKQWNEWLKSELIDSRVKDGPNAGSWPPLGIFILDRAAPKLNGDPLPAIRTALAGIRSHHHDRDAYDEFAEALSQSNDVETLRAIRADALLIDNAAAALVSARIGMVLMEQQRIGDATAEFKKAYESSDCAENMLALYVGALRQSGNPRSAVELLLDEAAQARRSAWRSQMIATLLLDPELSIDKPSEFMLKHLHDASRHAELFALCGQTAKSKGRNADAAALFDGAYFGADRNDVSSRREEYLAGYIDALRAAGRKTDALALLLSEAESDALWSQYRRTVCAELLVESASATTGAQQADIAQVLTHELAQRREIRLDLCATAAALALSRNQPSIAADLFALAYRDSGRLERYGQQWVDALHKDGRINEARDWLLRDAREDNKLGQWRMDALAEILLPLFKKADDADAGVNELLYGKPRAQAALKLALAHLALERSDSALAAGLFGKAYLAYRRPESLVEPYVNALLKSQDFTAAAKELEFVIPGGYQSSWAFDALRDAYERSGRPADDVLRAVTSEIELLPMDASARMKLAAYFEQRGQVAYALDQYRQAIRIRPEDAQLYRDLIEKGAAAGRDGFAREMLIAVLTHWPNHGAIWGVNDEHLTTLLQKYPRISEGAAGEPLRKLLTEYKKKDLVIVLSWDTDKTDVDLHITEPSKEECQYQHMRNFDGGFLDHDVTTGFGPEIYTIRRAAPGEYKVELHYYAGAVPTNATVKVMRHVGSDNTTTESFNVKLERSGDRKLVTTVKIP